MRTDREKRRWLPLFGAALVLGAVAIGCGARYDRSDLGLNVDLKGAVAGEGSLAVAALPGKPGQVGSASDDALIARVTATLLARNHYLKDQSPKAISDRLFDSFLDTIDPQHLLLLQSDVEEFVAARDTLDERLLKAGDTQFVTQIFARLLKRMDQQTDAVNNLLQSPKFEFGGQDVYRLDRKGMPRPQTLDEARVLWKERLRYEYLQEKLNKAKPDEIVKTLRRRYARTAKSMHALDQDDVLELYLDSLTHAYDPHSDYLGKASADNFSITMKLSLFGIGALLSSEDGYTKIEQLIPGGPAIRSGQLKVGDKIVAVAQGNNPPVDVIDMKQTRVVEMIRGPKGTPVKLTVIPGDSPDSSARKTITLVRDQIHLEEQEAKAKVIDMPVDQGKTERIGVIDLPSFYADMDEQGNTRKSSTDDVARLLKKLEAEKVQGVILDLRRNPGGSLQEAIRLTGLFIKEGPVVQVRKSDGTVQVDKDPDSSVAYDGPLVVMTSRGSASASEILAGALQDYGRALIVGDATTFGKGTVQTVVEMGPIMKRLGPGAPANPGALKLTIQKFYRPSGSSTQLKGVTSDIMLPSLTEYLDIGEQKLANPLPWDTIPSSPFIPVNRVQPYLTVLKQRSATRVAKNVDYIFLRKEIELYRRLVAEKTVSLNEQERLKEKQETEALTKARKEELKSHVASKAKVYALTLKLVDKPGLPAPLPASGASAPKAKPGIGQDIAVGSTADADLNLEETENILTDLVALSEGTTLK